MSNPKLEEIVRFDGGEGPKKWKGYGIPEGVIPDQYIPHCKGNAVNLNIYGLGNYPECTDCKYQEECKESAISAGESADG